MRLLVGIVAGIGLLFGAAWPASAGMAPDPRPGDTVLGKSDGLTYVSDPDFAEMATSVEVGAACPDIPGKWRVAGGGFDVAGGADSSQTLSSSSPGDLLDVYGDNDLLLDDFWRVAGSVSVGTTVTSYAICAKWSAIKQKRIEVPDSDSGERSHIAKCGRGEISGGGGAIATSNSYMSSMFPKKNDRWKLSAFDTTGGIGGMRNYVVCVRRQDIVIKKRKDDVAGGVSSPLIVAECPGNRSVVGGGAKSSGAPGTLNLRASRPYDDGDADAIPQNGWAVRAYNTDPGVQELKSYALCAA